MTNKLRTLDKIQIAFDLWIRECRGMSWYKLTSDERDGLVNYHWNCFLEELKKQINGK